MSDFTDKLREGAHADVRVAEGVDVFEGRVEQPEGDVRAAASGLLA